LGQGSKAPANVLHLPLSFEPNRGQADPAVKFVSHSALSGAGYALFLTEDGAELEFDAAEPHHTQDVVRMKLAGAQSAQIFAMETLAGKVNYFIGNDPKKWIASVPTYGKVNYKQIYPGVDLVYYGTQGQLEYDFVVAPAADASKIALEFSGAKPKLGPDGDLQLALHGGPLTLRKPVVYQTIDGQKKLIAGEYKLHGNRVQFALGAYDHSQALVIDPVLVYLSYYGGGPFGNVYIGYSQTACAQCTPQPAQGVAVDNAGNLYVTGMTHPPAIPTVNAYQSTPHLTNPNGYTVFVAEINPTASALVYSTFLGGSLEQRGSAIAVDSSGAAYVTGETHSADFPVTAGAYQTLCAPSNRGPNGTVVASCGDFSQNAFLTKLAPGGGSLVYSTFLGGGTGNDAGNAVAVDSQGRAYVAGTSLDGCDPGQGQNALYCFPETANALLPQSLYNRAFSPKAGNPGAAFVAVFDASGANLQYATLYGDKNPSNNVNNTGVYGTGVAVDSAGNFYLTGLGQDPAIPTTPNAFQTTGTNLQSNGGQVFRGFVAKFSPVTGVGTGASFLYGTYLGGTALNEVGSDQISGIAADSSGNAYITGVTQSYDFPLTPGANNTTHCAPPASSCLNIGFLTKLNPSGTGLVWSTLVGGPTDPAGNGTTFVIGPPRVDASGNVYITGQSAYNYPVVNPIQPAAGDIHGGLFVTKYDPTGSTVLFSTIIYGMAGGITYAGGIDVDSQGNVYVGGDTNFFDAPVTAGVFQPVCSGCAGYTGFVAKINPKFVPTVGSVVNAASFIGGGVVPGEIATAFGTDLTASIGINLTSGLPLVTTFLNDSLLVNNQAAPLFAVDNVNGQQQINFQVPWGLQAGSKANIAVSNDGAVGSSVAVPVLAAQPGVFSYSAGGNTFGVILHANYQLADSGHPVKAGETVLIYCTGLGAVSSPPADGAAGNGQTTMATPVVKIGGAKANVSFSGLAPGFVGLYQINAVIPSGLKTGNQPVVLSMEGASSSSVLLPVQ
jgi:uncharacterized protein (TIGR03437 family)